MKIIIIALILLAFAGRAEAPPPPQSIVLAREMRAVETSLRQQAAVLAALTVGGEGVSAAYLEIFYRQNRGPFKVRRKKWAKEGS